MINVIVNRTITEQMTPTMIGTGLSSPRIGFELESIIVTVELNIGSGIKD